MSDTKNTDTAESYSGLGTLKTFSVVLKNADNAKTVDISGLVINISIYEDIFSKTMYGEVAIKDSVNLLNGEAQLNKKEGDGFPIVGEEYIEIRYSLTDENQDVFRRFAVYSVKNISIDENLKSRNYILQFCSEEHLLDSTTLVQKSYLDNIGNMVQNILEEYLLVSKGSAGGKQPKMYYIQQTRGSQQIVIPKLSPLEAMDFLARRSISANELFTSASYLFFENKDGFNFCDIEYLISRGYQKIKKEADDNKGNRDFASTYKYYYQNPTLRGTGKGSTEIAHDDEGRAYKTIIKMTQVHKFDTIEKLKRGYFESSVDTYDIATRSVSPTVFKFSETYNKYNTTGSYKTNISFPENSLDFIRSVTQEPSIPAKKVLGIFAFRPNNTDHAAGKHTKTFLIPKDHTAPDTFLEQIYTNRSSYMTRFVQNMYTIEVYGDTQIGAGDLIMIDLPEIHGFTDSHREFDKYFSGYFLVGSIHHKLSSDSYHCTYDIFKNAFSEPVKSSTDPTDVAASTSIVLSLDAPISNTNPKAT